MHTPPVSYLPDSYSIMTLLGAWRFLFPVGFVCFGEKANKGMGKADAHS